MIRKSEHRLSEDYAPTKSQNPLPTKQKRDLANAVPCILQQRYVSYVRRHVARDGRNICTSNRTQNTRADV
jgi:hypothetical protein